MVRELRACPNVQMNVRAWCDMNGLLIGRGALGAGRRPQPGPPGGRTTGGRGAWNWRGELILGLWEQDIEGALADPGLPYSPDRHGAGEHSDVRSGGIRH